MAVCSQCGTTVPEEAKFCPACGQAITMIDVQPVTQEPVPVQYQPEFVAPQESPFVEAPQQSYYAQPQAPAPQQAPTPQQYYAPQQAPSQQQAPAAPQQYYAQQQAPAAPQYYAQQQAPTQQSYYAQPQAPAPQQAPTPQQSYYAQPQNQQPQQSNYAPQNPAQPQQSYYAQQNGAAPGNNYGYQQNYQQPHTYQTGPQDIEENKGICVLSYLGILLLIPLLSKPNSAYVRYHSNQGLVLLIFSIVIGILSMIPYLGWFIIAPVGYIFSLVCIIMGIVNTVNGQLKPLPLIGKITLLK